MSKWTTVPLLVIVAAAPSVANAQIVEIQPNVPGKSISIFNESGIIDLVVEGHCFGNVTTLPSDGIVTIFGDKAVAKDGNLFFKGWVNNILPLYLQVPPGDIEIFGLGEVKMSVTRSDGSLHVKGFCRNKNGLPTTFYNPNLWNTDPFTQATNNCYNYILDQRDGNCAQPGHGGPNPVPYDDPPTVAGMRAAAEHDRLIWVGDSFPGNTYDCGDGHLVFVAIRPGVTGGYHWYRLDQLNGRWSGKNSSLPATNLDDTYPVGQPIENPLVANRGLFTLAAGFYCTPAFVVQTGNNLPGSCLPPE